MKLVASDSALIGVMMQRCIDRGCEGGEENEKQAESAECCLQFYGQHLALWCDMCLMSAAINALQATVEASRSGSQKGSE